MLLRAIAQVFTPGYLISLPSFFHAHLNEWITSIDVHFSPFYLKISPEEIEIVARN